jgi:hypothetical protein
VHRALAPDQRFRVVAEVEGRGFSGLFLGTYSQLLYAAPCRVAAGQRLARCGFERDVRVEVHMHGAA